MAPRDSRAPPACILSDPAGVMGPCCCLVASSLWVTARGLLTAPRTPVQQGPQAQRAPLGVRWRLVPEKGTCARKSLDRCRDPRQPGQAPERVGGQPGPASEMSFSTRENFFSLLPLSFKPLFIPLLICSQVSIVVATSTNQRSGPTLTVLVNEYSSIEPRCQPWDFSASLGLVGGSTCALPSCCQMLLRQDGRSLDFGLSALVLVWTGGGALRGTLLALVGFGGPLSWC